jgi:hypothetical protein
MDTKSITAILSNLKSLVGEEAFNQSIAALPKGASALPAALPKAKKPKAEPSAAATEPSAAPKAPSAWNLLVTQTVAEMKQGGWPSWTDAKTGTIWPASRPMVVTDKKGQKVSDFVYDGGEHDGKAPSPALGGMVRASFIKGPSKASAAGSVPSGTASVASDEPKKKGGRPKMTEAQKAAAAEKRAAKKAAASIDHAAGLSGGWAAMASGIDLSFIPWAHGGKKFIKNNRGDVIDPEEGVWVGRFNGSVIDTTVSEPSDLAEVEMRE